MVLEVVGSLLPYAAGIALSPIAVVGVVLVVSGPRRRVAGPLFAAGWLVGLSALTAAAVLVGELVGGGDPARWLSALRLLAGLALVVWGLRMLVGGRGSGKDDPAWMAGLSDIRPLRAFTVGLGLAAANPKNIVLVLASASVIGQTEQGGGEALVEAAVFVLLASSSVLGVVLVALVGGDRGLAALVRVRDLMTAHHDVVLGLVLLLIGVSLTGDALAALA
jgi:threonine/homoserine/homoserine lactone efflux protein